MLNFDRFVHCVQITRLYKAMASQQQEYAIIDKNSAVKNRPTGCINIAAGIRRSTKMALPIYIVRDMISAFVFSIALQPIHWVEKKMC